MYEDEDIEDDEVEEAPKEEIKPSQLDIESRWLAHLEKIHGGE